MSALFGPAAYLKSRHTFTHSITGTLVVILIAVGIALLVRPKSSPTGGAGFIWLLVAAGLAAVVHEFIDLGTSAGVALLRPWRHTRFAWDWLPRIDPWILALLIAGILLPELFRLVGSEIGTKDTAPRGRKGAVTALLLVLLYVGARAELHGNAVAQLDAHTYRGESPRRLAAFADPVSLLTWHGVVETATQICTVNVPASETMRFDAESAACVHKPQDSPALATAEQTESVKQFLRTARFPKASVGAAEDGTEVVIRDIRNSAAEETRFAVAIRVLLNQKGQVTSQQISWANEVRLR